MSYQPTNGQVLRAEVLRENRKEKPYRAHISYEFETPSGLRRSEAIYRNNQGTTSNSYREAWLEIKDHPPGSQLEVLYDVATYDAVLRPRFPWEICFAIIPLIFVVIGLAVAFAPADVSKADKALSLQEEEDRKSQRVGRWVLRIFGLPFAAAGLFMLMSWGRKPLP